MVCEGCGSLNAGVGVYPDLAVRSVSCWPTLREPPPSSTTTTTSTSSSSSSSSSSTSSFSSTTSSPCTLDSHSHLLVLGFSEADTDTMTIVSSYTTDVAPVVVGERGVVDGRLLAAMSGVEAPREAAPSPPPSPPHPLHDPPLKAHHEPTAPPATSSSSTTTSTGVGGGSAPPPPGVERSRRKLENEDSSYDSDFEPYECAPASPRPDDDDDANEQHDDVCRTVSDTLGAEFAEYVTICHGAPSSPSSASIPASSTSTSSVTSTTTTTTTNNLITTSTASTTTTAAAAASPSSTCVCPSATSSSPATPTSTVSTTQAVRAAAGASSATGAAPLAPSPSATAAVSPPAVSVTPPSSAPQASIVSTPPTVTLTQPPASPPSNVGAPTSSPPPPPAPCVSVSTSSSAPAAPAAAPSSAHPSQSLEQGVSWVVQRPGYASQVEFGVKLGYSEALVQLALVKLGGTPDKDELLAELIRLGTSTTPRGEGEAEAPEDGAEPKDEAEQQQQQPSLKPIIIDGSNVAMSHGNKKSFSCRGLRICVEWFRARGHAAITVFVPKWRKEAPRWDTPIQDQEILLELEREGVLVFTPSRVCGGKRIVSYDDRYILNEAVASSGVVVSNDNYRDLAAESPQFRRVVEESLLMYSWVNGRFVPPDDPLGRNGPTLDAFLRRGPGGAGSARDPRQQPCPYGRKCTYGNKCKYMHPERGTAPLKSVTERLQEQAQRHYQNKAKTRDSSPGMDLRPSQSLPVGATDAEVPKKQLKRTQSIVPPLSHTLPPALTQETPTHDMGPPAGSSSHTHHHLMPPQHLESRPQDPLRSSLFKSETSLYHMYPSQNPQGNFGASPWPWKGQGAELPLRSMPAPQGAPSQGQPPSYGSHMPVSKQLSDPDPAVSENPHKKLQRQLTLNPTFDSRLYKIADYREPAPEHFPISPVQQQQQQQQQASQQQQQPQQQQQQPGGQGSPSRSLNRDESLVFPQGGGMTGRLSPGYSSPYGSREQLQAIHPPLARHSSSQEDAKHMTSLPQHLYPSYSHPHVTRFASAPDPIWGGQQQQTAPGPPHITRLNSTSDTRLNVYGCSSESQLFSEVFDDPMNRIAPFHTVGQHHSTSPGPGAPSPGPIGSRPMSPQQGVMHHSPGVSPRQHIPSQQASLGMPSNLQNPMSGAASHEDVRLRIFYHLSNLFPEAQVRAVLAMYPEETDPQKICSYIVSPSHGPVGSRPMSPQQPSQPGVGRPTQGVQSSSSPTGGFPNPLPTTAASHEDARFRTFYH